MKVQVNVNDDLVKRIDYYAKKMGVSRSSLCGMFIGQAVMTYDKSFDILDNVAKSQMKSTDADIEQLEFK